MSTSSSNLRGVNHLLHTLRGEHFRHSQNLQRSRSHVSAIVSHNSPTLPVDFNSPDFISTERIPTKDDASYLSVYRKYSGPEPPKSWTLTSRQAVQDNPAWRAHAVSLILPKPSSVPPLTVFCLQMLVALPLQDFSVIVPYISPHLRRDLIRHTAVHSPLPIAKLYALYEPDGHADTELIVVGPNAALGDDYFIRHTLSHANAGSGSGSRDVGPENWDSDIAEPELLSTLVFVSTRLATSTLLSLPPTITQMALVNISNPIPLHRLPGTCPLLVTLDLSFNTWLGSGADGANKSLERVEWSRWNRLRVLGLRECYISSETLEKINKGRWDDVQVVQ